MSQLDICHAKIRMDQYTVIARGETNPINYVEVELLRHQIGERNITDVVIVGSEETTNQDVLEDLRLKYGNPAVQSAFPGTRPRLPMQAPDDTPRASETIPGVTPKRAPRKKTQPAE